MFTFLFLSHKEGGIGSLVTNTWEREMCIIPVRKGGGGEGRRLLSSTGKCLPVSCQFGGDSRLEGHCPLALCSLFWGTSPREYIEQLWPLPPGNAAPQPGDSGVSSADLVGTFPVQSAETTGFIRYGE